MAEYLSIGPINAETAMWLRDASLEGKLPTIEQMTVDPVRVLPLPLRPRPLVLHRRALGRRGGRRHPQGHARPAASSPPSAAPSGSPSTSSPSSGATRCRSATCPEIGARARARAVADELLTEKRSDGTLHLAPALSPDGSQVAYFSEKDFYSVDLYLADGVTGKVKRRILKSGISSNYETYRFINSQANWSPDGKYPGLRRQARSAGRHRHRGRGPEQGSEAHPAQAERRHHAVVEPRRQAARLHRLRGRAQRPLRRQPRRRAACGGSPRTSTPTSTRSGRPTASTIAFATDRGPETDFRTLAIGNFRIALYDLGHRLGSGARPHGPRART